MSSAPARVNPGASQAPPGIPKIPFAFRADPIALDGLKLPRTARDVFVLLLDNARTRGWRSRLSNGTLARILGCCEMTVGRALLALERAGLIARDFTHGGRVRTGIRIVWDALQQPCGTERPCVQQERQTGPTAESEGFNIPVGLTRALPQREDQTAVFIPPGKDPGEVPDPATAAQFLRSMIQAGRKVGRKVPTPSHVVDTPAEKGPDASPRMRTQPDRPTPAVGAAPVFANCEKPTAGGGVGGVEEFSSPASSEPAPRPCISAGTAPPAAKTACHASPPAPPSGPRQDDPRREVARMVGSLAFRLATGLPGPRRMSPSRLARQLAEVRRKHGRADGRATS